MGVGDVDVAVGDVAGVGGVVEEAADDDAGPGLAGAGGQAALVEFVGDGAGAEPAFDVEAEDFAYHKLLVGAGGEFLGVAVDGVAVGGASADPAAFGGLGGGAGLDPVDDGVAFELGEHPQHLDVELAHGAAGVDRLGGRLERHPYLVQIGQELEQVALAAREPVEAVNEQDVEAARPGRAEGVLQAGPVEGGAGGVVGVLGDDGGVVAGVDVAVQPAALGVDGERLVVFVGGAAGVDRYPPHPCAVRCRRGGGGAGSPAPPRRCQGWAGHICSCKGSGGSLSVVQNR
nr:hypothetical protein [Pilimelia anulata]